ncbi:flagellar hook-length control protein FliK [Clostridium beijerinckii]|uniref:flagellar hook-length control protein FliK n=1 Tax=Clostridium beijerinckii TaxID=1520 RepID=UPI00156DF49D|nr:flagellar hook-length control protein FliK [Clostridium beijerinckii]NRT73670.1 flagellar hook-length control protein FliK [Clostridium beijerinckii]
MFTGLKNTVDIPEMNYKASIYNKSTAESNKDYVKQYDNNFKKILNSKSNKDNQNSSKVNDNDNEVNESANEDDYNSQIDELKDKLKELDKSSESDKKDKIDDILAELLNLLNKIPGNQNQELISLKNDLLKNNVINGDFLNSLEKTLVKLSSIFADDNSENAQNTKSMIKDLMSEISNIQNSKQNQKEVTIDELLKSKFVQSNSEESIGNSSSNVSESSDDKSSESDGKSTSKEEKFLNSFLNDDKDTSMDKINLFASRVQNMQQVQDTNSGGQFTINKTTFADDLIKDVRYMTTNSIKELTVKVNPGNLGEITIKLIQEDGITKANLKANSKETEALISQNLANIKNHLNEQNIKIDDINVEIYQEDTTFFSNGNNESDFSNNNKNNDGNSNSETLATDLDTSAAQEIENINNANVDLLA